MAALPISQTYSEICGDISKNGMFPIGGAWDRKPWSSGAIHHYTMVYEPSSEWYTRQTQQRKVLLNHAIVRIVPYVPHCPFPLDHFRVWRNTEKRSCVFSMVSDKYHQVNKNGPFPCYAFRGWSLAVAKSIMPRIPLPHDKGEYYCAKPFNPTTCDRDLGTINWPLAEEYFWKCTHPCQWPKKHHMDYSGDIQGSSSSRGSSSSYKNPHRRETP